MFVDKSSPPQYWSCDPFLYLTGLDLDFWPHNHPCAEVHIVYVNSAIILWKIVELHQDYTNYKI